MKKFKILGVILCAVLSMTTVSIPAYSAEKTTVSEKEEKLLTPILKIKKTDKEEVSLSWQEVDGAVKYQVYYSTDKKTGYKRAITTKKTSTTVKELEQGTDYYFKIRAIYEDGTKGNFSKIKTTKTKGFKDGFFQTRNLYVYISNIYFFDTVDNRFSDYNNKPVVAIGVVYENISDRTQYVSSFSDLEVFDPNGRQLDCLDTYFDDYVSTKIRPGAITSGFYYFPYVGDGEYVICIDPYFTEQEMVVLIEAD